MTPAQRILVVDDDDDIRRLLCLVLELEGYRGVPASNGIEALEILRENGPPALILIDLMMPGMDGEELVTRLHATRGLEQIPLVVLSGHSEARQRSSQLKVNHCLVKPVDVDQLVSMVRQLASAPPPQAETG